MTTYSDRCIFKLLQYVVSLSPQLLVQCEENGFSEIDIICQNDQLLLSL